MLNVVPWSTRISTDPPHHRYASSTPDEDWTENIAGTRRTHIPLRLHHSNEFIYCLCWPKRMCSRELKENRTTTNHVDVSACSIWFQSRQWRRWRRRRRPKTIIIIIDAVLNAGSVDRISSHFFWSAFHRRWRLNELVSRWFLGGILSNRIAHLHECA